MAEQNQAPTQTSTLRTGPGVVETKDVKSGASAPAPAFPVPSTRFVGPSNLPLTDEEKAGGLTIEQKRAGYGKSDLSDYERAYYAHSGVWPAADLSAEEQHRVRAARAEHFKLNPRDRKAVDNNPLKVNISINKVGHSVPPGPMTVGEFRGITRLTDDRLLTMNGQSLTDADQEIELFGGERFAHGNNAG